MNNFSEELWKLHYFEAANIEEELLALMPNLMLMTHAILLGEESEFAQWYLDQNGKEFAYYFLRVFFELMGSTYEPESHWVLKTPLHSLYPDVLMEVFPDARVIVPHRDPAAVVPSWTKLCTYVLAPYYNERDTRFCFQAESICRHTLLHMATAARRCTEQRAKNPEMNKQFCDVYYEELVADPIAVVRRIYEFYEMEYTPEFEERMKLYIRDNPNGKHGRISYSLDEFNVPSADVYREFSEYLAAHPQIVTKQNRTKR